MWRGRGRPHTAPGCRLCAHQRACPHVCLRAGLMFPPLPGSEGNPTPAEQSPVVAPREDTAAAAARPGHPLRAEVPGPPAAGASGPDPAASGGRSHLGWRLRHGQESLVTWLLCGNMQDPYKNTHGPGWKGTLEGTGGGRTGRPPALGPSRSPSKVALAEPWRTSQTPSGSGRGSEAGRSTWPGAPRRGQPFEGPQVTRASLVQLPVPAAVA